MQEKFGCDLCRSQLCRSDLRFPGMRAATAALVVLFFVEQVNARECRVDSECSLHEECVCSSAGSRRKLHRRMHRQPSTMRASHGHGRRLFGAPQQQQSICLCQPAPPPPPAPLVPPAPPAPPASPPASPPPPCGQKFGTNGEVWRGCPNWSTEGLGSSTGVATLGDCRVSCATTSDCQSFFYSAAHMKCDLSRGGCTFSGSNSKPDTELHWVTAC